jgi:hypothetical protein
MDCLHSNPSPLCRCIWTVLGLSIPGMAGGSSRARRSGENNPRAPQETRSACANRPRRDIHCGAFGYQAALRHRQTSLQENGFLPTYALRHFCIPRPLDDHRSGPACRAEKNCFSAVYDKCRSRSRTIHYCMCEDIGKPAERCCIRQRAAGPQRLDVGSYVYSWLGQAKADLLGNSTRSMRSASCTLARLSNFLPRAVITTAGFTPSIQCSLFSPPLVQHRISCGGCSPL